MYFAPMRRAIVGSGVCAVALSVAAPAAAVVGEPTPDSSGAVYRSAEWIKGDVGFNQRSYTYGYPPIFTSAIYAMSGVDAPSQPLKAGEVFYLHAWAGLAWAFSDADIAIVRLGLPEGVSVVPSTQVPVRCFITQSDTGYVPTRDGGCVAFPTGASGTSIQLGSFTVASGITGGSEQVSIFVPVVADRAINGDKAWVSTSMAQTPSILPNPLYGDVPLTVAPGSPGSPGGPAGPGSSGTPAAGLITPAGQKFAWRKRGTAIVSWQAVAGATSYRARLKVGKKWTKWASVTVNGLKLTKLKKGKRYTLQVQAVGAGGNGPTATWRFRAKR